MNSLPRRINDGFASECGFWEGDTEAEVRSKLANGYFDGDTQVDAATINGVKL